MSKQTGPGAFGRRLRRHSLILVAALGGAAGVAYAARRATTTKARPAVAIAGASIHGAARPDP